MVVNAYCALNETPAFRVDIYSPQRGRVRIYAEADGPVSVRKRRDYFTFVVESSPAPESTPGTQPLTLEMNYEALRLYEQRRYDAYLPSCFGGEQRRRNVGGCVGSLKPRANEWAAQSRAFLERANEDWYSLLSMLRTLASRYGAHPGE